MTNDVVTQAGEPQFSIDERDDDMLIGERHWMFGWRCIARRPKLMTNDEWRPEAERIIAALASTTPHAVGLRDQDQGASLRDRACAPDGTEPATQSQAEPLVPSAGQEREWTKWSEQRPPNAAGAYRYRATFDLLGVTVSPEWTEEMHLCGMGYSDSEWWPLRLCHWDGYQRRITIANLEWSPILAYDPSGIVWNGLDLLPCPFTGAEPLIEASGRYIGAPLWHSEALWLSSPAVPKRRWTSAKAMRDAWNTRAGRAQAMSASGRDPQGLEAKPASAVSEADAPTPSPETNQ